MFFIKIIGILIALAIIITIILFFKEIWHNLSPEVQEERIREKFGDNYKELIAEGKLSATSAAPCKPDEFYTDHYNLVKSLGLQLPYYRIISCEGTLADFTGDYSEKATIEFTRPLTGDEMSYIKGHGSLHSPYQDEDKDDSWWNISMTSPKEGVISYGRV